MGVKLANADHSEDTTGGTLWCASWWEPYRTHEGVGLANANHVESTDRCDLAERLHHPPIHTPILIIKSGYQYRRARRRFRVLEREEVAPGNSQGCRRFLRDRVQMCLRSSDAGWSVSGWSDEPAGRRSTGSWSAKRP